jgi:hypothetical protein
MRSASMGRALRSEMLRDPSFVTSKLSETITSDALVVLR